MKDVFLFSRNFGVFRKGDKTVVEKELAADWKAKGAGAPESEKKAAAKAEKKADKEKTSEK